MRIGAVLFDLDDTLHDDTAAFRSAALDVAREVASARGVDAAALAQAYIAGAERFWKALSKETLGASLGQVRARMWEAALQSAGIDDPALAQRCADAYNRSRARYLQLWPGVRELLERLRASGTKLGLITNGFSETHREKIALLRLERSFDAIFIADEVGMVKPDPALFRHACSELGVGVEAAVMVGDRYDRDVRGALEAGLHAVWLNVRAEQLSLGVPPPHLTVATIGELDAALRSLAG